MAFNRWAAGYMVVAWVVVLVLAAGCAPGRGPVSVSGATPPAGGDRAIRVKEKMRRDAVSPGVGRWAVVIGISDYKYDTRRDPARGIPDLRFADDDARAFARFLTSPAGGAFKPDHVLLLTDRKATIKEVRKGIGDFLARSLEDDLVIIFYAGHGIPDPKNPDNLYLACHDTEPGNLYGTALPMWEIDVVLNRTIRSRRVFVFADACHSAGVAGSRGGAVSKRFNEYMARLAGSKEGVTKITASRADELSQERAELGGGHGVFTYYLLRGLEGGADANRDGFVTMAEAYDFLYDRVRSDTRHSQNPWASAYVSSDIPLGIVDAQVLAAVKARAQEESAGPAPAQNTYYQPGPARVDLPRDSAIALKLARARLAKGETGQAAEMVDEVIRRNDASKPDALLLRMEMLLADGDLAEAEDVEDLLVIPYPKHPAAGKGARLIYDYYLNDMKGSTPGEKIRALERYLTRHPAGPLEKEARQKLGRIRAGIKTGYEKGFAESLVLIEGFIGQKRFDRARAELERARGMAGEALSGYGVSLDTHRLASLGLRVETEEERYLQDRAFEGAKREAARKPLEGKIALWREFVGANPGNAHLKEAKKILASLEEEQRAYRERWFREYLDRARGRLKAGDFKNGYEALEKAREYATPAQAVELDALARRYNAPPRVEIALESATVDWDTPLEFKYNSSDREGDRVRVVGWDFGDGRSSTEDTPRHSYAKWEGPDKERRYQVRLRVTDGHSTVTAKRTVTVRKQDRVKTFTVKGVSFKMIRIPAGEFMMGSPSDEPGRDDDERQHRVRISKTFWMGETEVTQGLWKAVMGNNPSYFKNCGDDCPVENVSWNDARAFIQKLNRLVPGGGFRLPTEAEWEYAARAGSTGAVYTGPMRIAGRHNSPDLDPIAWYGGNSCVEYGGGWDCSGWSQKQYSCSRCGTHPVGKKRPNAWGLYDMIGNVWEWCLDWYGEYPSGSVTDPAGPSSGSSRVLRGGSWLNFAWYCRSANRARYCRSVFRDGIEPGNRDGNYGFRLARYRGR